MKFKIEHSDTDEFKVYRKFHYSTNPLLKLGIKGFSAVVLLAIGSYFVLPTPDEILTMPVLAKVFSKFFQVSFSKGLVYAFLAYKAIGVILIICAAILGGKYIQDRITIQKIMSFHK